MQLELDRLKSEAAQAELALRRSRGGTPAPNPEAGNAAEEQKRLRDRSKRRRQETSIKLEQLNMASEAVQTGVKGLGASIDHVLRFNSAKQFTAKLRERAVATKAAKEEQAAAAAAAAAEDEARLAELARCAPPPSTTVLHRSLCRWTVAACSPLCANPA